MDHDMRKMQKIVLAGDGAHRDVEEFDLAGAVEFGKSVARAVFIEFHRHLAQVKNIGERVMGEAVEFGLAEIEVQHEKEREDHEGEPERHDLEEALAQGGIAANHGLDGHGGRSGEWRRDPLAHAWPLHRNGEYSSSGEVS